MMKVTDYIDKWGLIDKLVYPDGGDTCWREGLYWSLFLMMDYNDRSKYGRPQSFNEVMEKLHPHPGVLLRHFNPDYDSSDWDRMSRDQLKPMIVACGYWSKDELNKLAKGHFKRGFLFCNNVRQNGATKRNHGEENYSYAWRFPDVTLIDVWSLFIRAFKARWLYPLLLFFDAYLVITAVKWRWFPKHNIAHNSTLSMMQAHHIMPTPLSWLAEKIMPAPKMIEICKDNLNDHHPTKDTRFLGDMMTDAWNKIKPTSRF